MVVKAVLRMLLYSVEVWHRRATFRMDVQANQELDHFLTEEMGYVTEFMDSQQVRTVRRLMPSAVLWRIKYEYYLSHFLPSVTFIISLESQAYLKSLIFNEKKSSAWQIMLYLWHECCLTTLYQLVARWKNLGSNPAPSDPFSGEPGILKYVKFTQAQTMES